MLPRLACCFAILTFATHLRGQEKEVSPFYPMKVGTTWHYQSGDDQFVSKVEKHETIDGVECAVIASSLNGKLAMREYVGVKKDGIYRFQVQIQMQKTLATPPLLFFRLPAAARMWNVESSSGGIATKGTFTAEEEEETEVPAGKFPTIKVKGDLKIGDTPLKCIQWFAKDVGIVKQKLDFAGQVVEYELEKFEPGK